MTGVSTPANENAASSRLAFARRLDAETRNCARRVCRIQLSPPPAPVDPTQKVIFNWMPIFVGYSLPAALATTNSESNRPIILFLRSFGIARSSLRASS